LSRIVVTGGAGFIGGHLADALVARGDEVVVVDDLSTGSREHVPKGAELVVQDVAEGLGETFAGADAVLHVAGQASIFKSFDNPEGDLRTNVLGTINVIEACVAHGVERLVFAGSMTAYGEPERVPTPEDEPCVPVSYYGVTKYAAERYVHASAPRGLAVTTLRMFNVYGERQSLTNPYQGVLAIFLGNVLRGEPITIHSDGLQTRDFVYVGDVVDAWLRVLDDETTHGRVFNVGSGRETSIGELAGTIIRSLTDDPDEWEVLHAPSQRGDILRSAADIGALVRSTGWAPLVSLEEGITRTAAWAKGQQPCR
jgi:UDP-glucose 4-epimerase